MPDPRQSSAPAWAIRSVAVRSRDGPRRVAQVYRRLLAPPCDTASSDAIEEKPAEPPTHAEGE